MREIRIVILTEEMLKQIKGIHGQINAKCSKCGKEFTNKDIGKTIVSFVVPNATRRKKIAKSHVGRREYLHGSCFNAMRGIERE